MPRPGPRPYECVRRAWHSDRHQPMRGSIIQQIFRVVNEAHSSSTKKNKEWQEKLPVVVLKAEEIMYSKANSEAEYTNPDTLWERVNDAINTIIRREETTETGDLLPPCVEAALNLGCVPVRASRSQRHCNPRNYLTPRTQEPFSAVTKTTDERQPHILPIHSGSQTNFVRTPVANSVKFPPNSSIHINRNDNLTSPRSLSLLHKNIPIGHNQVTTMTTNTTLSTGSVYPLYYGTHYQKEEYQSGSQIPEKLHYNTIYVGTPVTTSTAEPTIHKCFSRKNTENASNVIPQMNAVDAREKRRREAGWDLSLRLGSFSNQVRNTEKRLATETEDVDSCSREGAKLNERRPFISQEFCFFPGKSTCDPSESSSRTWSSGGEGQTIKAPIPKGKEPFSRHEEDGQFCWQPDVPSNWFSSRLTRPGS
ncbi:uncharacterized protein LOC115725502 isoform X2 [Cannabis sativa]|uniref:Coactivator CBP, KIX domain-containing protein n=3 Tax=Cannabis sativa TaxID=3483 RepID=A0A7J6HU23_CANSA|nr:uncharacterized protein LOC115725502 isoform X2 [Cannabis sativa]KAF4398752.1 hypothetical protein G4B88_028115 [Cannabis sativa]